MSNNPVETMQPVESGRAASARPAWEEFFERQIEATRRQVRWAELAAGFVLILVWCLVVVMLAVLIDGWIAPLALWARWSALVCLASGAVFIAGRYMAPYILRRISPEYAAKMIEDGSEGFHNSLLNYLFLRRSAATVNPAILQSVGQRASQDIGSVSPLEKVDYSRAIRRGFILMALFALFVVYAIASPKSPWPTIQRLLWPGAPIPHPATVTIAVVHPGDAEVVFGQKLLVSVEVRGRHDPQAVRLLYSTFDGQQIGLAQTMRSEGDSHRYQLELATTPTGIQHDLRYWIEVHDGRSVDYTVTVLANPTITVNAIEITPPEYTELPPRRLDGRGDVEGPDGSLVKVFAQSNLPIDVAYLELLRARPGDANVPFDLVRTVELTRSGEQTAHGQFHLVMDTQRLRPLFTHYQVKFRSTGDRRSELINVYPIRIIPDLPPEVRIVRPTVERIGLPINRELEFEIVAMDRDYKLSSVHLNIDHQGSRLWDEECQLNIDRNQQQSKCLYRLIPTSLHVQPGDELIVFARAADNRTSIHSNQLDPNVSRSQNIIVVIEEPSLLDPSPTNNQPEDSQSPTETAAQSGDSNPGDADTSTSQENATGGREQGQDNANQTGDQPPQPPTTGDQKQNESRSSAQDAAQQQDQEQRNQTGNQNQQSGGSDNQRNSQEQEGQRSGNQQSSSAGDNQQSNQETSEGQSGKSSGDSSADQTGEANSERPARSDDQQSTAGDSPTDRGSQSQPDGVNNESSADSMNAGAGNEDRAGNERQGKAAVDGTPEPLNRGATDAERMERLQQMARGSGQPADSANDKSRQSTNESTDNQRDVSDPDTAGAEGGDKPLNEKDADQAAANQGAGMNEQANEGQDRSQGIGEQAKQEQHPRDHGRSQQEAQGESGDNSAEDRNRQVQGNRREDDNDNQRSSDSESSSDGEGTESDNAGKQPPSHADQESRSVGSSDRSDASNRQDGGERAGDDAKNQSAHQSDSQSGNQSASSNNSAQDSDDQQGHSDPDDKQNGRSGSKSADASSASDGAVDDNPPQASTEGSSAGDRNQKSASDQADGEPSPSAGASASNQRDQTPSSDTSSSDQTPPATAFAPGGSNTGGATRDQSEPFSREDLEFSRETTEMVLDYLRQQQNEPDPRLLEAMNWTADDLRDFLARWELMKQRANVDDAGQRQYEEALQSLGLRRPDPRRQSSRGTQQGRERLSEDGAVLRPPPQFAEQFNAFMKNVNRLRDDK